MKIKLFGLCLFSLLILGFMVEGGVAQWRRSPFPSVRSADQSPIITLPPNGPSRSREFLRDSFKKTQKDTEDLYVLASELKEEMDHTTEDVLSIKVMKKAEEIEKLAEKIKNRMKNL